MSDDFYRSYEDFSEMDQFLDELKQTALKNAKEEFLQKMERLEKENAELQEVKKNWNQLKLEVEREKENYKFDKDKLEREIARKKINELLKMAQWSDKVYYIDSAFGYVPKCGKCDNREIHFTSPSGNNLTEPCPVCGKYWCKYIVKEMSCFKLRFSNDPCIKCEVYFVRREEYSDSTIYHSCNIFNGTAEEFNEKSYNKYNTAFTSKELAQQICDKINKNNGVPDNIEYDKE